MTSIYEVSSLSERFISQRSISTHCTKIGDDQENPIGVRKADTFSLFFVRLFWCTPVSKKICKCQYSRWFLLKLKNKSNQTNYSNEISHKLLRRLIWKHIGNDDLKRYISSQMHYTDVANKKPILSQLLSIKAHYCDIDTNEEELETISAGLVNLRGLESALIAVSIFKSCRQPYWISRELIRGYLIHVFNYFHSSSAISNDICDIRIN